MAEQFEKHARTVTLLTLASRVTGLARDAALSRVFGLSALTDAFWFAFIIPNLFRRLFGEGALSAAFLPVYSQLDKNDPQVARRLATLTISLMIVFLGGITLLGELILWILSNQHEHDHLALKLMMIMLPYMPLVCLVAILGAMLQVHGRFGPTAAAPIVLNLLVVAAAWGGLAYRGAVEDFRQMSTGDANPSQSAEIAHISLVSFSVLLAGIVQLVWSIWSLQRSGAMGDQRIVSFRNLLFWRSLGSATDSFTHALASSMKRVLAQAWPMFIGLGVLQINALLDNLIASYPTTIGPTIFGLEFPLKSGALTALSNAQRLYEFPLGVFGIAVATAIFPALARVGGAEDRERFAATLRRGLRLVMFIGLPASIGLILVREPLTAVVYQGGDFSPEDTRRVAFVLLGYAPAIWAYSMTHTLTRAFYAKGDSMTPVKVAVSMVALNLLLNFTLIWTPLREAGLAWSTAICATLQTLILLRLSRRYADDLVDSTVRMSWLRTVAVTAIMAGFVLIARSLLPAHELAWRWALIELAVLVSAGAAAVLTASVALRMPEFSWALGKRSD
ncbi:MAG: murein biosynthesis integral membrane protein MurJ [Phycisphaerales bacterium]|nr:murein biosynthesis integral membrane protein MurJ [Phycisphaerales bacterium]